MSQEKSKRFDRSSFVPTERFREALNTMPVADVMADLSLALDRKGAAVLQAPPGTGKTTLVPLALAAAPWIGFGRILLLEPRRLAARMAARRMADLLGQPVGRTVGYAVRLERRIGLQTRIEVLTEGVLTGRLQQDPALEGVGLVIFDEFHERHLESDLGLALCREIQQVLNPELRLLVMSATLDAAPVAALLGNAPVIRAEGRRFAVETRYRPRDRSRPIEQTLALTAVRAALDDSGSILAFLPGAAEIRRALAWINRLDLGPEWIVAPLCGMLGRREQDLAVSPAPEGRRKIVLATAIAETSLTIEGIRVVIDSGLARRPCFDPVSGMTRLVTLPVTRDEADQRRGRAGRLAPGICYRLWSEHEDAGLMESRRPEILDADLTGLALELACWGTADPEALAWLDPPPKAAFEAARLLLVRLGALNRDGRVSPHGQAMARIGVHPRLSHMLLRAQEKGQGWAGCVLAAVLSERNPQRSMSGVAPIDIRYRVDLAIEGSIHRLARSLARRVGAAADGNLNVDPGPLLAWAYPDRIARLREGSRGRFLMANGREAVCDEGDGLAGYPYLVIAELDGNRHQSRIFLAATYDRQSLEEQFAGEMELLDEVVWDDRRRVVAAYRSTRFGAFEVHREPLDQPDPARVADVLAQGIRRLGIACLPWTRSLRAFQQRVGLLRRLMTQDGWPDLGDEALAADLDRWLGPYLYGVRSPRAVDLASALNGCLDRRRHQRLDQLAPTHLCAPSGARLPIDYSGAVPVLAARVQQMFGCRETPTVAGGRQAVIVHMLSPAGRPVQITQDLAGFWRGSYPEVRKALRGRYPRHPWPEDPLAAAPTNRAKER